MSENIDLMLDGRGEQHRLDRLMRTFMRIDQDLRSPIVKLSDHEGQLIAHVKSKNINLYNALQSSWAAEEEYQVEIVFEGNVVCEMW